MIEFIDSKCPDMKYINIAKKWGVPPTFIYNLRYRDSGSHRMETILRVMKGLSGMLGEDAEDLFVKYILNTEVLCGDYPDESFSSMRGWLLYYKGEMTFKDLCEKVGIPQGRLTMWFSHEHQPKGCVVRWLLMAMDGSSEEQCRAFFRVANEQ